MKLKGLAKLERDVEGMKEIILNKIDEIDWDKDDADEKEERLNDADSYLSNILEEVELIQEL